jgi:hypothetical protein
LAAVGEAEDAGLGAVFTVYAGYPVVSEECVCSGDLIFEVSADFDLSSSAQIEGEFRIFRADQEGIAVSGEVRGSISWGRRS